MKTCRSPPGRSGPTIGQDDIHVRSTLRSSPSVTRLERRLERRHQECRAAYGCGTDGVVRRGAATTKHPTPYSATQRYAWR